jgi:hypothetical protein
MSGTEEDEGEWTCVARLQGQKQEGQDFITLKRSGKQINLTAYQPTKSVINNQLPDRKKKQQIT